jgi:hypothetical protein
VPDNSLINRSGERPLLVADLGIGTSVDLGRVVDLVREVESLREEPVLMPVDRDRCRLAAPGERADRDPVRLLECLGEHAVAALAVFAGAELVRVLEVHRVDGTLWHEGINDERRRGCLLERLQLLRLETHVIVLGDLVPTYCLLA